MFSRTPYRRRFTPWTSVTYGSVSSVMRSSCVVRAIMMVDSPPNSVVARMIFNCYRYTINFLQVSAVTTQLLVLYFHKEGAIFELRGALRVPSQRRAEIVGWLGLS